MDGGSNNDDLRGGSSGAQARPPLESIQEFQVVTNQFDAEYGAATAGVVNAVTKQGTNTWHGSAFGYFTDSVDDRRRTSSSRSRTSTSPTRSKNSGAAPSAGRSSATRCTSSPASSARTATRAGAASTRRARTGASRSRRRPTPGTTWGALDHQLNASHNYSVRFLWDHQPNYNQVLGDGTIARSTRSASRRTTTGRSSPPTTGSSAPTELNTMRASAVHEKPKRGQPLYQETGDWTQAPPTLQFLSFIDQAGHQLRRLPRHERLRRSTTRSAGSSPARGGSHDLKFGAQYQLGEHYREDQRVHERPLHLRRPTGSSTRPTR